MTLPTTAEAVQAGSFMTQCAVEQLYRQLG